MIKERTDEGTAKTGLESHMWLERKGKTGKANGKKAIERVPGRHNQDALHITLG